MDFACALAIGVKPARVDAKATGTGDIGLESIANHESFFLLKVLDLMGRVFEKASVRLGESAFFRNDHEINVRSELRDFETPRLHTREAIGDNADLAFVGELATGVDRVIDENAGAAKNFKIHVTDFFGR